MSLKTQIDQSLPGTGYVRLSTILSVIPISRSSWWAGVKDGRYPQSYKLGNCTFWKADDIRQLIAEIAETEREEAI